MYLTRSTLVLRSKVNTMLSLPARPARHLLQAILIF